MLTRTIALTPDLVAKAHRVVTDPGPDPSLSCHTDENYNDVVRDLLRAHPAGEDPWLFAYGSLIWRPEIGHVEERMGTTRGRHRAFRLRIDRWRRGRQIPDHPPGRRHVSIVPANGGFLRSLPRRDPP